LFCFVFFSLSSQYQQIIQELAQEISQLRDQRSDLESRISHMEPKFNGVTTHIENKSKLEEALKLRESLLHSFKEQIGLRKNLLELDNAIMDMNIEADRHNKIIENWEAHKENNLAGGKQHSSTNNKNNLDQATFLNSLEELKVVEHDREDLEQRRKNNIKELERVKSKTVKLRDSISKKLNTNEQKEILNLLLKNFEFEIKNIEMQAELFKRDFKLREQDQILLRLEQHRSLCDTLIYQQRRLITDNSIIIPSDLDELYHLYSRDVNEGQLIKDISSTRSASNSSLTTSSPRPSGNTFLTQIQEESYASPKASLMTSSNKNNKDKTVELKNHIESISYINSSPWSKKIFSNFDYEADESNRIFYKTNNNSNATAKQLNNNSNSNNNKSKKPTTANNKQQDYSIGHLTSFSTSRDNKNNLSMLSNSSTNDSSSNGTEVIDSSNSSNVANQSKGGYNGSRHGVLTSNNSLMNANIVLPPGQIIGNNSTLTYAGLENSDHDDDRDRLSEKNAKRLTQGIAAVAAQRKASLHHKDLMQELGRQQNNVATLSNNHHTSKVNNDVISYFNDSNSKQNGDNATKMKKKVKIRDLVQYKTPEDNSRDDLMVENLVCIV
jgi:hypothetical protein